METPKPTPEKGERRTKRKASFDETGDEGSSKKQKTIITLETPIPSMEEHNASNYTFLKKLVDAGGMNAGIEIVRRKSDQRLLVRKTLKPPPRIFGTERFLEMQIQRFLSHPTIVAYAEAYSGYVEEQVTKRSTGKRYTGLLYMPPCDLDTFEALFDSKLGRRARVPEQFFWHVLVSVLTAIIYCQTGYSSIDELLSNSVDNPDSAKEDWLPIAHMDLHGGNIFLSSAPAGEYPIVQLGDFGAAVLRDKFTPLARYQDVKSLLGVLKQKIVKSPRADEYSEELRAIVRLHNDTAANLDMRRFDVRNVARMVKDALDTLDLPYEDLPAGADEPSHRLRDVSLFALSILSFISLRVML